MFCKYFLPICDLSVYSFNSQYFLTPLERFRDPWQTCCLIAFLNSKTTHKSWKGGDVWEKSKLLRNQNGEVEAANLSSKKPIWILHQPQAPSSASQPIRSIWSSIQLLPEICYVSRDLVVPLFLEQTRLTLGHLLDSSHPWSLLRTLLSASPPKLSLLISPYQGLFHLIPSLECCISPFYSQSTSHETHSGTSLLNIPTIVQHCPQHPPLPHPAPSSTLGSQLLVSPRHLSLLFVYSTTV